MSDRAQSLVIRASAGTGKTFALSGRYLSQLQAGARPDEILATTFTRKAAGEILERVLLRLARAAIDEEECRRLAGFLHSPALCPTRVLELLAGLARSLHRVRISTLDSFFAQLAGSFGLELGLPPGWRIVEVQEDELLRRRAIDAVLQQESTEDIVRMMNLLTQGEAGRSVGDLVRSTVNSLYETYQEANSSAWSVPRGGCRLTDNILAKTIDELRGLLLPSNKQLEKARNTDVAAAENGDWETFISKGIGAKVVAGVTTYYKREIPPPILQVYRLLTDHACAVLLDQWAAQTAATHSLLEKFDREYQRRKQEARAMRFDDITRRLSRLARAGGMNSLGYRFDGHINHLLLDEFQDTSGAQWRVLRPLAEHVTSGDRVASFYCVGDIKQAIYGWRGGVAKIFDAIAVQLQGLSHQSFNASYRSAGPIIETVNRIFENLTAHRNLGDYASPVARWQGAFEHHSTRRAELPGYARLVTAPAAGDDEQQKEVTLQYAAQRIAAFARQAPGRSIGVLTRTNGAVGRLIYELRRLDVRASEEGGNPLTDSAAVQIVCSLLRIADHPDDRVAGYHLATSPVATAFRLSGDTTSVAACDLSRQLRRQLLTRGYGPLLQQWAATLTPHCGPRDCRRLEQLVDLAYQYQPTATLRAVDFVNYLESQTVSDPTADDVRVMTIHQAKGLEFDIVVLPELDVPLIGQHTPVVVGRPEPTERIDRVCLYRNAAMQALLPDAYRQLFLEEIDKEITEALCRLYVSVTRAACVLEMIVAPSRSRERNLPKTSAGLLRAALTAGSPLPADAVAYEYGDADWPKKLAGTKAPSKAAADLLAPPRQVRLAPLVGGRTRGLQRTSPSAQEGGTHVKVTDVLRLSDAAALQRGTVIHAWFEQVTWLEDGRPDEQALRQVAAEAGVRPENCDDLFAQFTAMLQRPAIAQALSRQSYQPPTGLKLPTELQRELSSQLPELQVHNERRFAIRLEGTLLTGSIDRLVLMCRHDRPVAADIIDFKTDQLDPGDEAALARKVEFYRHQLDAYRPAVAKLFKLSPEHISARLLMLSTATVVDV